MLYWIYIAMTAFVLVLLLAELWRERDWRAQVALAMLLVVFALRVLRIK